MEFCWTIPCGVQDSMSLTMGLPESFVGARGDPSLTTMEAVAILVGHFLLPKSNELYHRFK